MKYLRHTAMMVGTLGLATAQAAVAQDTGVTMPKPGMNAPVTNEGIIEDEAVDALRQMSAYLMKANTLQVTSLGSLDAVTNNGQRIQLDGTTTYKIRRPGFVIDYRSDIKNRRFIYDGKTFTVYSPTLGYYASAPAPGTNREVLDTIYNKFGISLPLEDLFRWADPSNAERLQALQSAYDVGTATIDGVETDHYAFREGDVDWEVWIQQGDQPLPRKLVIVDRNDPAKPTFIARLSWQVNPVLSDADFTFVPDANAKRIQLANYKGSGE
ncbi:MAG: DUF2092 domain-containing protein [Sphingomicrobium sp.]